MKKRLISFSVLIALLFTLLTPMTLSYADEAADIRKLYAFGFLDNESVDLTKTVTRAKMAKYASKLYGVEIPKESDTIYSDVLNTHESSGAVNFACEKGIISRSDYFYPDKVVKYEEAVKMIICALEYDEVAQKSGGYPYGYLDVAANIGLLKNVNLNAGEELTLKTVVTLLINSLYSSICNKNMIITKDGKVVYEYIKTTESDSVLRKRFGTSKYKAFITDLDEVENTIKVEIKSAAKGDENDSYTVGEKVTLNLSLKGEVPDSKYTFSEIYVNDENSVLYIDIDKKVEVITGVIYEVNKSHNNAPFDPADIKNIAFESSEDYIDIARDCIMEFGGEVAKAGYGYNYIGAFARAVVYNDEVIALEAWELLEGGIITEVQDNYIKYTKGDKTGLLLNNLTAYKDLTVYVNGEKSEYFSVIEDVIFDYFKSENNESIIIVISTNAVTETFNTVSSDSVNIGGDNYALSDKVYYSADGLIYNSGVAATDLLSKTITAYIDFAGYVRYVKPFKGDSKTDDKYAVITGYSKDGLAEPEFEVYVIETDKVEKKIFALSESFAKKNEGLIETIKNTISNINSADVIQKNDVIKTSDLLYKIRTNDKNQIIAIDEPTHYVEPTVSKDGFTVSEMGTSSTPYISRPRIYLPKADICAFYYSEEDGISVQKLQWKDLMAKSVSGIKFNVYSEDEDYVNLMLLRGDISKIEFISGYLNYGLCTNVMTGYDSKSGEEVLNITVDGNEYTLSKYKNMFDGVTSAAFITYTPVSSFISSNEIKPTKVYNLSGDPQKWKVGSISRNSEGVITTIEEGIHKDELRKISDVRVHFTSGDSWYMPNTAPVYEVVTSGENSKLIRRERGEVSEGADVWYIYYRNEVRALFYEG